jgi:hypothetical protein
MSTKNRIKQPQIILNTVLITLIIILSAFTFILFKANESNMNSAFEAQKKVLELETDLRNRGIVDGELLEGGNYEPYSTEQMNEFQEWVKNR